MATFNSLHGHYTVVGYDVFRTIGDVDLYVMTCDCHEEAIERAEDMNRELGYDSQEPILANDDNPINSFI